jgi:hypothetical protein
LAILRYIKAAGVPACDSSTMEEVDVNVMAIARAMLRAFGARAGAVMRKRIRDHERAGETEGAEFWTRVEQAIDRLKAGAKSEGG